RTELQRSARAADAGGAQKGVSMIECGKGMNKLKAAKAMVSMWHRSCLPAPTRWSSDVKSESQNETSPPEFVVPFIFLFWFRGTQSPASPAGRYLREAATR